MSEVSVKTMFRKTTDVIYVKNLEIHIPGYFINARLIHLDEVATNSSYDVWVARDNGEGKTPTIVRDWTMRGAYQPRSGGDKMFDHRNNYGATIYTLGGDKEGYAKNNLIAAIFDALLGSCDTSNTDVVTEYVLAAEAMHESGVVQIRTDNYRASVITPCNNLNGSRTWHINSDGFKFGGTIWTFNIDSWNRLTHRDDALGTTAKDVVEIMEKKALAMFKQLGDVKI